MLDHLGFPGNTKMYGMNGCSAISTNSGEGQGVIGSPRQSWPRSREVDELLI